MTADYDSKVNALVAASSKACDLLGYLIDHLPDDKRDNSTWMSLRSALRDIAPAVMPDKSDNSNVADENQ